MATNGHGRLRIAQVAPLYESVPPQLYGGTERIVSYLTEELVAAGHDVALFASGDSRTSARLVAGCPRSVSEVLDHGVTGLICDGVDQAVAAVGRIHELSRAACRDVFERRFTAARMASDYTAIYHRILQCRDPRAVRATGTHGEREDHGHHGARHDDPGGLLDPRDQLASR